MDVFLGVECWEVGYSEDWIVQGKEDDGFEQKVVKDEAWHLLPRVKWKPIKRDKYR